MRFLGTSAGEGIPTPFCECPICQNARTVRGKELRLRSSFRIDEKTAIDLGADFVAESVTLGESLYALEDVLYTHTHEDHFNYHMMWTRFVARKGLDKPLNIWMTGEANDVWEKFFYATPMTAGYQAYMDPKHVSLRRLEFYKTVKIGDKTVIPLKGEHSTNIERNSANYLIALPDKRVMYYALDTGYYREETFDYLKTVHIDLLISECTFPIIGADYAPSCHMDVKQCIRTFDRLFEQKTIDKDTKIYLTHISPFGSTHEQLSRFWETLDRPYRAVVAYDGMRVE